MPNEPLFTDGPWTMGYSTMGDPDGWPSEAMWTPDHDRPDLLRVILWAHHDPDRLVSFLWDPKWTEASDRDELTEDMEEVGEKLLEETLVERSVPAWLAKYEKGGNRNAAVVQSHAAVRELALLANLPPPMPSSVACLYDEAVRRYFRES